MQVGGGKGSSGMRRGADGERGSGGTSLAFIILMPAVLLLVFGGIQFALHSYARGLVLSAAQAGVRAAAAAPVSAERGQEAARLYLANQADGSVRDAAVTVVMGAYTVTVTVSGSGQSLIPGWDAVVSGQASGPLEVLT